MKVPVTDTRQKIGYIIVLVFLWLLNPLLFALMWLKQPLIRQAWLDGNVQPFTPLLVIFGITLVMTFVLSFEFASVHIDENGVRLKLGLLRLNKFSWDEIQRVEVYDVLNGRGFVYEDTLINVLVTDKESWSFVHKMQMPNYNRKRITFFYNSKALSYIKKHCNADVCRAKNT